MTTRHTSQSSTHSRAKQEEGSRDSALVHQCIHINARMWTLPVNILISNEQLVKVIYTVRFISHHCTSQVNQWYASARNWTLLLVLSRVRRKANVSNKTTRETELYVEITLARSGSPSTPATREENEANTSHVRRGESFTTRQRRCAWVTVFMHSRKSVTLALNTKGKTSSPLAPTKLRRTCHPQIKDDRFSRYANIHTLAGTTTYGTYELMNYDIL